MSFSEQIKTPRFGDLVENGWASEENPTRRGYFVRAYTTTGRMNPGLHWQITNKRGKFWDLQPKAIADRLMVTPCQEGSAIGDGGDGVPVRSLSVRATDKSDRAEGVAALQQAAEPVAWMVSGSGAHFLMHNEPKNGLAPGLTARPLYSSPPQQPVAISREELTSAIWDEAVDTLICAGLGHLTGTSTASAVIEGITGAILAKIDGPLPQQPALVEQGVEKIIAQHEPAACGEGTLPSPSEPPRSDGGKA